MTFKLLGSFALRNWLNSSFITFKNEYNHLLHLLVVLLQVLNVSWLWEPLSFHGLQVITTLTEVMDDPIWSFLCGVRFLVARVTLCKTAKGRLSLLISRLGDVGCSQTSGTCRTSWRVPLHLPA